MKGPVKIIVIILAALLVLYAGKDFLIKSAVSGGIKAVTGLNLSVKSMKIGLISTLVDIRGIKLLNPPDFPEKLMMDMPELYVDYELGAIFGGKVHLISMKLDLKEFNVIKKADGKLNLDSIKTVEAKKVEKKGGKPAKMPSLQIDSLDLKIGKVVYKDYSKGSPPVVREFNVDINEHYTNITNPYALGSLIIVKALQKTAIASLANFDLGPFKLDAQDALETAKKIVGDTAVKALEESRKVLQSGQIIGGDAGSAAQDAVNQAQELIKGILPKSGN